MQSADSAKIKESILREIYEDNQRLADPHPQTAYLRHRQRLKSISRPFPILLVTLLFILIYFIPNPEKQIQTEPAASVITNSVFPWAEIIYKQHLRSSPTPVVSFDAGQLLNYDLLLNHDNIRLSSVFGLGIQTIVIDPGHGGKDPGAIGSQGTREKDIVLDIALQLRDQLTKTGRYKVLLTRDSDTFISLADRVKFANENRADLFISLHINALPQKEFNVTETYYFGPPSDLHTLRLAEQENRGSEILTGDFKNMIKKIGDVLKEQESATLASTLQHSLFSNMKKYDRVIADNGIKIAPFVVLLGVDAPSVLVEISCISKNEEETNLNSPVYREKITASLKKGITGYLTQRHAQVVKGDDNGKKIHNKKG
jgi:N-acetylmuramoyl-L-alanine amidase